MDEFEPVEPHLTSAVTLDYAGFWVRLGASLIDGLLMLCILIPLLTMIYGKHYWFSYSEYHYVGVLDFTLNWIALAVATLAFWITMGATPGKMALRLQILDAKTGDAASTSQLLGRYVRYFLSMIPFCMGYIWVGIDQRKQGWHDKIAGTVVVQHLGKEPVRFEHGADAHPWF